MGFGVNWRECQFLPLKLGNLMRQPIRRADGGPGAGHEKTPARGQVFSGFDQRNRISPDSGSIFSTVARDSTR